MKVLVIEDENRGLRASCPRDGVTALYTYTDLDEPGTSLRAAGWHDDGTTRGGEWDRPSRQRPLAISAAPKRRWRTPWSPSLRRSA